MCLVNGARFMIIPEAHYFYRSRPGSIVADGRQDNMEQLRNGNISLLEHKRIKEDTELAMTLSRRLLHIEQRIVSHRILQTLKERAYSKAFFEAVNSPDNFFSLLASMPETIRCRFHRHLRKIKTRLNIN